MPTPASPAPAPYTPFRGACGGQGHRDRLFDVRQMADADASTAAPPNHLLIEEQSHALADVLRPVCAPCADKHSAHGLAWFVGLAFVAGKVDGDRLILGDEA